MFKAVGVLAVILAGAAYRIPVIIIDQETVLEGRIEFRDLAKAFRLR